MTLPVPVPGGDPAPRYTCPRLPCRAVPCFTVTRRAGPPRAPAPARGSAERDGRPALPAGTPAARALTDDDGTGADQPDLLLQRHPLGAAGRAALLPAGHRCPRRSAPLPPPRACAAPRPGGGWRRGARGGGGKVLGAVGASLRRGTCGQRAEGGRPARPRPARSLAA